MHGEISLYSNGLSRTRIEPVSRLSGDILRIIFSITVKDQFVWLRIDEAVKLSHVSRTWRALALDCASLWSQLIPQRLKSIPTQLERSKGAPLDVLWNRSFKKISGTIESLIRILDENSDRLRSLELCLGQRDFDKVLPHCLKFTPMLQSLVVAHDFLDDLDSGDGPPPYRDIFVDILDSSPSLRSLNLADIILPWPQAASRIQLLTHLEIEHRINLPIADMLTLPTLLQMLSNMPKLEFLRLSRSLGYLCDTDPGTFKRLTRVPLPALRTFKAGLWNAQSAVVLSRHLSPHPQCAISYICQPSESPRDAPLETSIRNLFPSAIERLSLSRLQVTFRDADGRHDTPNVTILGTLHPKYLSEDPEIQLHVGDSQNIDFAAVIRAACDLYDIRSVRRLHLQLNRYSVSIDLWKYILDHCSGIEDLTTSRVVIEVFLSNLESDGTSLFSALQSLEIISEGHLPRDTQERLARVLRGRTDEGFGLHTLTLTADPDDVDWTGCAKNLNVAEELDDSGEFRST